MTSRKEFAGAAAFVLGAALWPLAAGAQTAAPAWKPDRPVTIVVPYGPGGGSDSASRAVANYLGKAWNQTVTVENLAGADGLIGTRRVMEARPDGLTLLAQQNGLLLTRFTPGFKGVDPMSRLEPVVQMSESANTLVVKKSIAAQTFPELFKHCGQAKCSFGTASNAGRLQGMLVQSSVPSLVIVGYKGSGAMLNDIMAGTVDMGLLGGSLVAAQHKAGAVRVLATLGDKRPPSLPDVPTAKEAGLPELYSVSWYGMFAPKGTPPEVVSAIAEAVTAAMGDPAVIAAIKTAGAETIGGTPAQFRKKLEEETARVEPLVARFKFE
ncbi:tripartite tricarboxylate transporter substrate binding protein [Ramlibacter sp.]|uniref:tripartite tricarboxylate transporter substrate binding protein n=1 Tax=Ramlibacter sp. TaxID=1917967 RepID=UPI003D12C193